MSERVKIGLVPASRTIFDQELATSVRGAAIDAMAGAGLQPVVPGAELTRNGLVQTPEEAGTALRLFEAEKVSGVVVAALNFGNEIPAATAAADAGVPVMLFGVGEEGELGRDIGRRDAFCGLLSIATALRHRGVRYAFPATAVTYPHEEGLVRALAEFGAVCRAVGGIRGGVYGQIGPRPADFESCAFDELSLLRKFGVRVVPIPLSTLFSMAGWAPEKHIRDTFSQMESGVDRTDVSDLDLSRMARLEVALMQLVEEHGLDGLAIQCWTSMQDDYGVSPCFAMARIIAQGIPCACEVDIHGALSMQLLQLLGDAPAALADWNNRHYEEKNAFSAWHCGVFPPSLSSGPLKLSLHDILAESTGSREGKFGTLEQVMDEGPVTMARLTEHADGTWPLMVAEGDVVTLPGEPPGSHGWVSVSDLDRLYAALLRGFPHHTAIARGRLGGPVLAAAYFLGLDPIAPLPLEPTGLDVGPVI